MTVTKDPDHHEEDFPLLRESTSGDENRDGTGSSSRGSISEHHHHPLPPADPLNDTSSHDHPDKTDTTSSTRRRRSRLILVSLLVLFMIMIEIGVTFINTPMNQIQENILCRQLEPESESSNMNMSMSTPSSSSSPPSMSMPPMHLLARSPDHPPSKRMDMDMGGSDSDDTTPARCKTSQPVQREFSIIQSWLVVLMLLPGLVMAVPLGLMADKHGRTWVLSLSMAGMTLNFAFSALVCLIPDFFGGSLRWVWAGTVFNFLGGGMTVFSAMLFSMLADVCEESERALAFSYLSAGMMFGAIIAPPLTYWLMKVGPWFTVTVGLAIMVLSILFAYRLPETLKTKTKSYDDSDISETDGTKNGGGLAQLLVMMKADILRVGGFVKLLHKPLVLLLLLSLLLNTFGSRDADMILTQYVTVKFGWSWSEAGLITSIQSISSLILLTALLPFATKRLLLRLPPRSRDLWLSRISILLSTTGAFLIGAASAPSILIIGVSISALGLGFSLLIRGLLTSLMPHDIALLNSVIAWVETAGAMIATPLLAGSFRLGLDWGGGWTGLPFFIASLLFGVATVLVFLVRVREAEGSVADDEAGFDMDGDGYRPVGHHM